jgi:hypothetical protein
MNKRKLNDPIRHPMNDNSLANTRKLTRSSQRMRPISNADPSLTYIPPKPWKTVTDSIRIHLKHEKHSRNGNHHTDQFNLNYHRRLELLATMTTFSACVAAMGFF